MYSYQMILCISRWRKYQKISMRDSMRQENNIVIFGLLRRRTKIHLVRNYVCQYPYPLKQMSIRKSASPYLSEPMIFHAFVQRIQV